MKKTHSTLQKQQISTYLRELGSVLRFELQRAGADEHQKRDATAQLRLVEKMKLWIAANMK